MGMNTTTTEMVALTIQALVAATKDRKVMTSRFASRCAGCSHRIAKGELIGYGYKHAICEACLRHNAGDHTMGCCRGYAGGEAGSCGGSQIAEDMGDFSGKA